MKPADSSIVPAEIDRLLRTAIAERRLLQLTLKGCLRVVEPHDYGIRRGTPQLLAWQVAGESNSGRLPGWRWISIVEASAFKLLAETFAGNRPGPTGQHSRWDRLFVRVAAPSLE
jgi:hypothetical protein